MASLSIPHTTSCDTSLLCQSQISPALMRAQLWRLGGAGGPQGPRGCRNTLAQQVNNQQVLVKCAAGSAVHPHRKHVAAAQPCLAAAFLTGATSFSPQSDLDFNSLRDFNGQSSLFYLDLNLM